MTGDVIAISIEPTIAAPKHPIEAGQAKDCEKGPCPPDSLRHEKIRIGAGFDAATARQYQDVIQQLIPRDLQAAVRPRRLQVFEYETSPFEYVLP